MMTLLGAAVAIDMPTAIAVASTAPSHDLYAAHELQRWLTEACPSVKLSLIHI